MPEGRGAGGKGEGGNLNVYVCIMGSFLSPKVQGGRKTLTSGHHKPPQKREGGGGGKEGGEDGECDGRWCCHSAVQFGYGCQRLTELTEKHLGLPMIKRKGIRVLEAEISKLLDGE